MFNPADAMSSPAFQKCVTLAQDYLIDREKAGTLIASATTKLDKMEASRGPIGDAVKAARTGVRMIKAYVDGGYRKVPVKSLASIAGAMLYFMQENDLIDDDTPLVGYVDDAAVIMLALKLVQGDLDDFLAWEKSQAANPSPAS
jgi:uncharacterized membrane protein YkvA (DUF1232 family)